MVLFWKTKVRKIKENLRFSNISTQYSLKNLDSREELTKNYLVAQLCSAVIFFISPPATLQSKQGASIISSLEIREDLGLEKNEN